MADSSFLLPSIKATPKPMNSKNHFGRVLKEVRQLQNMTQIQLATNSNLDRTYISLLERGLRIPTLKTLCQLSGALNKDTVDMMRVIEDQLAEMVNIPVFKPFTLLEQRKNKLKLGLQFT